jgi:hypothetical protein
MLFVYEPRARRLQRLRHSTGLFGGVAPVLFVKFSFFMLTAVHSLSSVQSLKYGTNNTMNVGSSARKANLF